MYHRTYKYNDLCNLSIEFNHESCIINYLRRYVDWWLFDNLAIKIAKIFNDSKFGNSETLATPTKQIIYTTKIIKEIDHLEVEKKIYAYIIQYSAITKK